MTFLEPLASKHLKQALHCHITALGIFRGVKAAEHLLSGTKQVPSTNRYYNEYQKSGNFAKALEDFDSVKPTNVRKFNLPDGVCN